MAQTDKELKDRVNSLKESLEDSFLLVLSEDKLLSELETTTSSGKNDFDKVIDVFSNNLRSIISISKIPLQMSAERSWKTMYNDIYRKESILSIADEIIVEPEDEKNLLTEEESQEKLNKIASEKFNNKIKTIDGNREFWLLTLQFISQCSNDGIVTKNFLNASKELLNQASLLIWSTLEVLFRDFFIITLNNFPNKVPLLSRNKSLSKKFSIRTISSETLIENDYDLSGKMGDVLINNFEFSNLDVVKQIYKCLFGDKHLNKILKDENLWKLYQRRNLIVHRGGIIDEKYLSKTSDSLNIGEKLYINTHELKLYLSLAVDIGTTLKKLKIDTR